MKAEALVIADVHVKDNNGGLIDDIFNQAIAVCNQHNIKKVIIAGDIFEYKKSQSLITLKTFDRVVRKMMENEIDMLLIAGNHDKVDESVSDSYVDFYSMYMNVTLMDDMAIVESEDMDFDIHMLPYFSDAVYAEKLRDLSEKVGDKDALLVTHIGVEGGKSHKDAKSEISGGVSMASFKAYKNVLSGHYHNRQKVSKNFEYVGSPYPSNFGEDNDKGFTILYEDMSTEFVRAEFKEYITKRIDITDMTDTEVSGLYYEYEECVTEHFLRLIITGTDEQIDALDINHFRLLGIKVETVRTTGITCGEEDDFIEHNDDTVVDAFKEFCSTEGIADVDMGVDLIKQAYKKWEAI